MHPSFILGGSASRVVLMNTHQVIFLLFFVHRNRILMNVSVKFAFSILNRSAVIPETPEGPPLSSISEEILLSFMMWLRWFRLSFLTLSDEKKTLFTTMTHFSTPVILIVFAIAKTFHTGPESILTKLVGIVFVLDKSIIMLI